MVLISGGLRGIRFSLVLESNKLECKDSLILESVFRVEFVNDKKVIFF